MGFGKKWNNKYTHIAAALLTILGAIEVALATIAGAAIVGDDADPTWGIVVAVVGVLIHTIRAVKTYKDKRYAKRT